MSPGSKESFDECQGFLGHENDGGLFLEFLGINVHQNREILPEEVYSLNS